MCSSDLHEGAYSVAPTWPTWQPPMTEASAAHTAPLQQPLQLPGPPLSSSGPTTTALTEMRDLQLPLADGDVDAIAVELGTAALADAPDAPHGPVQLTAAALDEEHPLLADLRRQHGELFDEPQVHHIHDVFNVALLKPYRREPPAAKPALPPASDDVFFRLRIRR